MLQIRWYARFTLQALWAARHQLAVVYLFAGVAKADPDWLNGSVPAAMLAHPARHWFRRLLSAVAPGLGRNAHLVLGWCVQLPAPPPARPSSSSRAHGRAATPP